MLVLCLIVVEVEPDLCTSPGGALSNNKVWMYGTEDGSSDFIVQGSNIGPSGL